MKYSTPSIEVVTFNPSDAPRIGMQWWYETTSQGTYATLGQNWTPTNTAGFSLSRAGATFVPFFNNEPVDIYACHEENIPGAMQFGSGDPQYAFATRVIDDLKSC